MTNALDDVDAAFTKQTGIKVVTSYDASSALIKQIEGGAPADAFVSADLKWMDYGVEKKVINESTRINLLGNILVLIAAKDSKIDHVDIEPGFDLAKLAGGKAGRHFDGSRSADYRRLGGDATAEDGSGDARNPDHRRDCPCSGWIEGTGARRGLR
jgi:molybdenum ABC transporter molybdate-binding protein